jgi:hypothetical protein
VQREAETSFKERGCKEGWLKVQRERETKPHIVVEREKETRSREID